MPEPRKNLEKQADAGRGRPVMRMTGPGARNVGGVGRGQIDAALAVAEQVERVPRELSRHVEFARIARALEQRDRGARNGSIVVKQAACAGTGSPPGVQEPAVAPLENPDDEIEGG